MPAPPRRRRPRVAFHYKVDEDLKPADREPYLALLRDPRTRIDDARRWLLDRGYAPSRSAVARHRRRLLAADAEREADVARAFALAKMAAAPDAPDFTFATEYYWQHLVMDRLLAAGQLGAANADAETSRPLTPRELLDLGKAVAQAVQLTRQRLLHPPPPAAAPAATADANPPPPKRSDEQLRKEIEDILFHGK